MSAELLTELDIKQRGAQKSKKAKTMKRFCLLIITYRAKFSFAGTVRLRPAL